MKKIKFLYKEADNILNIPIDNIGKYYNFIFIYDMYGKILIATCNYIKDYIYNEIDKELENEK